MYGRGQDDEHGSPQLATADSGDSTPDDAYLREQLVGLTMASEVCARWLHRENPNLAEVKSLVAEMITVSRRALASLEH